jgi:hypothetical protein
MSRVMRDRSEIAAIIKAIPPTYAEHIAILLDRLLQTADVTGQTKDDIEEATQLERIKARLASIATIANTMATQKQAEAAILQVQQQIDQLVQMVGQKMQGAGLPRPGGQEELPLAISEAEKKPEPEIAPPQTGGGAGAGPAGPVKAEAMLPNQANPAQGQGQPRQAARLPGNPRTPTMT